MESRVLFLLSVLSFARLMAIHGGDPSTSFSFKDNFDIRWAENHFKTSPDGQVWHLYLDQETGLMVVHGGDPSTSFSFKDNFDIRWAENHFKTSPDGQVWYLYLDQETAPRSGLAWKHSIDVGAGVIDAGVIDAGYRGPVGVILFNHADANFEVKARDRIAQLIIAKIMTPQVLEVEDLDLTVRGEGGFGFTGV